MKRSVKYYLDSLNPQIIAAVTYVLDHLGRDYQLSFYRAEASQSADICIGVQEEDDFTIAINKLKAAFQKKLSLDELFVFDRSFPIISNQPKPDYILSAFVLLSGMQEWVKPAKDKWGRFPFSESLQAQYGSKVAWVDKIFQRIFSIIQQKTGIVETRKSVTDIVLTHDIDLLRWPVRQNTMSFIKRGTSDTKIQASPNFLKLFKNTRRNIDQILAIEEKLDLRSVFFWLTETGRGKFGIKNADYSIKSQYVKEAIAGVEKAGGVNGLHKSSKDQSIVKELKKNSQLSKINRYHFLLFNLPEHGQELNVSVKQDYSYGFAEQIGFRNSYSLPFHPFDFDNWRPFKFLEVPLHIMDGTFYTYLQSSPKQAKVEIIDFLSRHKSGSCLSILWHNEYFTPFKYAGWSKIYEELLEFLFSENEYHCILPEGIERKYRIY